MGDDALAEFFGRFLCDGARALLPGPAGRAGDRALQPLRQRALRRRPTRWRACCSAGPRLGGGAFGEPAPRRRRLLLPHRSSAARRGARRRRGPAARAGRAEALPEAAPQGVTSVALQHFSLTRRGRALTFAPIERPGMAANHEKEGATMSESKTSQVRETQHAWKKMVDDQRRPHRAGLRRGGAHRRSRRWRRTARPSTTWPSSAEGQRRLLRPALAPSGASSPSRRRRRPPSSRPARARPCSSRPRRRTRSTATGRRRSTASAGRAPRSRRSGLPLLLVPSMINRWYVLDLRERREHGRRAHRARASTRSASTGASPRTRIATSTGPTCSTGSAARCGPCAAPRARPGWASSATAWAARSRASGRALNPDHVAALVNLAGPVRLLEGGLPRRDGRRRATSTPTPSPQRAT